MKQDLGLQCSAWKILSLVLGGNLPGLESFWVQDKFLEGKHWDLKKYLWSKISCSKVVESKKIMGLSKVQGPIKLLVQKHVWSEEIFGSEETVGPNIFV